MRVEIEKIIGMDEIKDLCERTNYRIGTYMFSKGYIIEMLKGVKIEFFNNISTRLEREEFDVCFSVERSLFLRKDVKLTDREKLWGYEVRKNLEKEYTERRVNELRKEGLNIWYIVGREWGIYFILKRW